MAGIRGTVCDVAEAWLTRDRIRTNYSGLHNNAQHVETIFQISDQIRFITKTFISLYISLLILPPYQAKSQYYNCMRMKMTTGNILLLLLLPKNVINSRGITMCRRFLSFVLQMSGTFI